MSEHRGSSFYNSCVKVPVDPYSRQPTPFYERCGSKSSRTDKKSLMKNDQFINDEESMDTREIFDNFLEFLESIPDYSQVHHLSNDQFKQKVEYLKRRQKYLLSSLQNALATQDDVPVPKSSISKHNVRSKIKSKNSGNGLALNGKKCYLEASRISTPLLFLSSKCDESVDQMNRPLTANSPLCNKKDMEVERPLEDSLCLLNKNYIAWNELHSDDDAESDIDSIETRSLPASITKEWQPTVPKPFSFTLREDAEKYMIQTEKEEEKGWSNRKKSTYKKRRVKPIPITSKIPLYDKLLEEKEERSRIVREESAINLMSQVRPFRLECDRRAWRALAKSSPEIRSKDFNPSAKFKAKPVPKNLFSTEVYDRMLEDEYYRHLQKKVRAAHLMKSSSLPPSMARRERVKSACTYLQDKDLSNYRELKNSLQSLNSTPISPEQDKSISSLLPLRGNNLAAILRCKVSREKLERDIRERMEEKRREQAAKFRESLIGRNPAWRALRSAARYEHERDLCIRAALRRNEAREQAERHRAEMEMMLDRVTQIPTLFERHSQRYQASSKGQQKASAGKRSQRKKKKKKRMERESVSPAVDLYMDYENASRSDSGTASSSASIRLSENPSRSSRSSKISSSQASEKSGTKSSAISPAKGKGDRSRLKVSINETAELIGVECQKENGSGRDEDVARIREQDTGR